NNTLLEISQRNFREQHVLYDYVRLPGQAALDRTETAEAERTRIKAQWDVNKQYQTSVQGFVEEYKNLREDSIQRSNEINNYNVDWQNFWRINESQSLIAGLNVNGEDLTQVKDGVSELQVSECGADLKCQRDAYETYVQVDKFLSDEIEILAGFRWQDDSDFGSHFAPKISAMYRTEESGLIKNWRASVGNGYRVPNLKERY